MTAALMGAWVIAVGYLGYMSGISSSAGWTVLAAVSTPPPALLVWLLDSTASELHRDRSQRSALHG